MYEEDYKVQVNLKSLKDSHGVVPRVIFRISYQNILKKSSQFLNIQISVPKLWNGPHISHLWQ